MENFIEFSISIRGVIRRREILFMLILDSVWNHVSLAIVLLFTNPCFAVDPLLNQFPTNEDLAKYYFEVRFPYKKIVRFLLIFHGLPISVQHLHRLLFVQKV